MFNYTLGYGVCLSNLEFKENAAYLLLKHHMTDTLMDKYKETFETNDGNYAMLTPTTAEIFAKEYQNDKTLATGLPAMIVEIINEERNLVHHPFTYEDQCIYVQASIPIDIDDKNTMLTQKDIQRILREYLNPIICNNFKCDYLNIMN